MNTAVQANRFGTSSWGRAGWNALAANRIHGATRLAIPWRAS